MNSRVKNISFVSKAVLIWIFSFVLNSSCAICQTESNEYNVKAMFILNFMKYVDWPEKKTDNLFNIGVGGETDIYDALKSMVNNRNETGKIKIERISQDEAVNYNIIILSKKESRNAEEWVKKYQGKGVLIITDEYKGENGGAINLVSTDNKIRFEINHTQAKLGGVKISSRLSEFAITVHP